MFRKEYLVLPLLVVLLFLQFLPYQLISVFGQEIYLKTELYDPRDVFRGDYVALNFTQERVSDTVIDPSIDDINRHYDKALYAKITHKSGLWQVENISLNRPQNGLYIKCKLDYYDTYTQEVVLDFGIERYYIQTNTGQELEEAVRQNRVLAQLKVWRGQMVMTGIKISD